jgi:hypothetical protein
MTCMASRRSLDQTEYSLTSFLVSHSLCSSLCTCILVSVVIVMELTWFIRPNTAPLPLKRAGLVDVEDDYDACFGTDIPAFGHVTSCVLLALQILASVM